MTHKTLTEIAREQSVVRVATVIDHILEEIHCSFDDPERMASQGWGKIFGSKDSLVTNVQKLVATLAALPVAEAGQSSAKPAYRLTDEEMKLLTEWLAQQKVNNANANGAMPDAQNAD